MTQATGAASRPVGQLRAQIQAEIARVLAVGHLDPDAIVGFTSGGQPIVRVTEGPRAGRGRAQHFATRGLSLAERLYLKTDRNGPVPAGREWLGPCHLWLGGYSRSGRRNVRYPAINEGTLDGGTRARTWRCCRLALLLYSGFQDVPEDEGELLIPWLHRANRYFRHLEASHDCDNSECVNGAHLRWLDHKDQIAAQRDRMKAEAEAEGDRVAG